MHVQMNETSPKNKHAYVVVQGRHKVGLNK